MGGGSATGKPFQKHSCSFVIFVVQKTTRSSCVRRRKNNLRRWIKKTAMASEIDKRPTPFRFHGWPRVGTCGWFQRPCWWGGMGMLSPAVVVFVVLAEKANPIDKGWHRSRKENGRWIQLRQNLRILQGSRHPAIHHTDPKSPTLVRSWNS